MIITSRPVANVFHAKFVYSLFVACILLFYVLCHSAHTEHLNRGRFRKRVKLLLEFAESGVLEILDERCAFQWRRVQLCRPVRAGGGG